MAARRKRQFSQFSISFIDCMCCGLGAVVLIFMIIHHSVVERADAAHRDVASEVSRVESEVLEKSRTVEAMAAALEETTRQVAAAKTRAASVEESAAIEVPETASDGSRERIAAMQKELRALEKEVDALQSEKADATRSFAGKGRRQYLTGLDVGGRHLLILVDTSASMLGDTIVDVIRRRNMPEEQRRSAPKWRRVLDTVDWITTQVPRDARFQIIGFNAEARPVLPGTEDQWLPTDGGVRLTAAVAALRRLVPENGTSLARAFAAAARLSPKPDAIYLVTDGLPTQGGSGIKRGTVAEDERLRLYREAVDRLPRGAPVNVILFQIEGDPLAASAFWQLAQLTGGALLSPPTDWP